MSENNRESESILRDAEKILRTLASEEYKHSTGNKNTDSEVDVPLTYADYYFLEALIRWSRL